MNAAHDSQIVVPCAHVARTTCDSMHKRPRSPPWPVVVADYRPYGGGQLRQCYEQRRGQHADQWNCYYRNNTINGYKDRHYILREFHELRRRIECAVSQCGTACDAATRRLTPHSAVHCDEVDRRGTKNDGTAGDGSAMLPAPVTCEGCDLSACPRSSFSWLEAGCGVGNAMLPIFEQYGHLPQWRAMFGFDISAVAIDLLERKRKELLLPELAAKLHVCVHNPCEQPITECDFFRAHHAAPNGAASPQVTFVSLIFVLCSIPMECHVLVLRRLAACMSPQDGVLFFRDYAVSDLAESRFRRRLKGDLSRSRPAVAPADPSACARHIVDGKHSKGDDHNDARVNSLPSTVVDTVAPSTSGAENGHVSTFMRCNGTLSHFFLLEEVDHLFTEAGFATIELEIVHRDVTNHKLGKTLSRCFVQGRFRLKKYLNCVT